ncbi:MAG: hypothetical protein AB2A00_20445 [Myxococcota bacterium]
MSTGTTNARDYSALRFLADALVSAPQNGPEYLRLTEATFPALRDAATALVKAVSTRSTPADLKREASQLQEHADRIHRLAGMALEDAAAVRR